ncbi:hypothetical protein JCM6882_009101 [Rhodosporidiobolus microsporus]
MAGISLTGVALVALALAAAFVPSTASTSSHFTNNWAVLVCTSRFWFNYRHMANTLAMYRTVKRLGIPDSQIILMLADDAACNPRNPFAATVYSNAERKTDLYGDKIEVDYKGEEVSVETFLRLLSGRLPESTPASKRLMTDENSNIFVFMTGHGGDEFLKFQDNEEISAFDIADAFGGMWAKKRYNEIFFMVDTCQAHTLYSKFYSPNILAAGSSKKDENSYSHHADADIGVAVTDRYTHHVLTFLETISKTSKVTLQNLFDTMSYEVIHSTPGVREDLFHRPLTETLLTDFFGGVSEVELSGEEEEAQEEEEAVVVKEPVVKPSELDFVPSPLARLALCLKAVKEATMQSLRAPLSALTASTSRAIAGPSSSTTTASASLLARSPRPRAFCSCPPAHKGVPRPARQTPPKLETPTLKRGGKLKPNAPDEPLFRALAKVPAIRGRPSLISETAARELVRAWGVHEMQDVVVVDSWAGPGGLTRAYLELPNVKKVICLEDAHRYDPMLDALVEEHGDRVTRVVGESFVWETYTEAEKHFGDLVPKRPWEEGIHPNLFVSAQLPNNVYGNLMFVQMVAAISGHMWLYQYGRIQLGFLGPETLWNKILANPGDNIHHKLSVLIPSLATISRINTLSNYQPPEAYFHKPRGDPALYSAVKVTPFEQPKVKNYEALEYITKNMFVTKALPWHKALAATAPGANNLVQKAVDAGLTDMKKTVNQLSQREWIILADLFEDWPFRPQTLFDDFSWENERI